MDLIHILNDKPTDIDLHRTTRALLLEQLRYSGPRLNDYGVDGHISDDGHDEVVGHAWLIDQLMTIDTDGDLPSFRKFLREFSMESSSDSWCDSLSALDDEMED